MNESNSQLTDFATIVSGGTPSTKVPDYWLPEIDWVTAKDVSETSLAKIHSTERKISKAGLKASSAKMVPALTTVLIARGATMGKCRMVAKPMAINQTCYALVAKNDTDPLFLYYYLSNLYSHFRAIAHGTVFDTIISSGLHSLPVNFPQPPIQRRIGEILGRLDDKIEVNRRANATLEAMAQALYKHWFVDFAPFQGGKFVESELGPIPEGWGVGRLGDVARVSKQGVHPGSVSADEPYIGLSDMPKGSLVLDQWNLAGESISTKYLMEKGDILFGKLRPYFKKVGIAPVNGICSTDIYVIKPKRINTYSLTVCNLIQQEFIDFTESVSDGTRMPRVSWGMMSNYPIAVPPVNILDEFERHVRPWLDIIPNNVVESRHLAATRDYLLPKLLSGEIAVEAAGEG